MVFEKLDKILERYRHRHEALIGMLQDVQRLENYLPLAILQYIGGKLEVPLSRIYHIATFYRSFSLVPRGKHIVKVCLGTASHLNGAVKNLEQIQRSLDIGDGGTAVDRMFSLEMVNYVGTCALSPVTVVGDKYYDAVTPGKVEKIISSYFRQAEDTQGEED